MQRSFTLLFVLLVTSFPSIGKGDILLDVQQLPSEIVVGTSSVTFELTVSGNSGDENAAFNAFTYAIEASTSSNREVSFGPINDGNLSGLTQGWTLVDDSPNGQIAFGNVVAPQNTSSNIPGALLSLTLDTSALLVGDEVTLDLDAGGFASVSNAGSEFTKGNFSAPSFVVTVPEPGSFGVVGVFASLMLVRRRRRSAA